MASVILNADQTLTVVLDAAEQTTLAWAMQQYGLDVVGELVTNWLKDRERLRVDDERQRVHRAFWTLTAAERAAFLVRAQ